MSELARRTSARIIFATTTSVIESRMSERFFRRNDEIARYNAAVVPALMREGVLIDDLYSLVNADIYKYIREDDLTHLNHAGIEACSAMVADFIRGIK